MPRPVSRSKSIKRPAAKSVRRTTRRQPFRVLDLGMGEKPIPLVKRAAKYENAGHRKRVFVGVDREPVNITELLRETGLKRLPKNLKLIRADAFHHLQKIKPNSQNLIVASFLLNNIIHERKESDQIQIVTRFLGLVKRALKPGGRIAIMQSKVETYNLRMVAPELGLSMATKPIPDPVAQKSHSEGIQMRSTFNKRMQRFESDIREIPGFAQGVRLAIDHGVISDPQDYYRPMLTILKKPLESGKIKPITMATELASLSPTEFAAVREILGQ